MKVAHLGLRGIALQAAQEYEARYPGDEFTSGRRDVSTQARAMAQNVAQNRKWIAQTYKPSVAANACQAWVDAHPQAKTVSAITIGLVGVLAPLSYEELAALSCHLSGDAFDVEPDNDPAKDAFLKSLAAKYGGKYLDKEGGLKRRHWQAKP